MSKFKVGDVVYFVKREITHGFEIGDKLTIITIDTDDMKLSYKCVKADGSYEIDYEWFSENELEYSKLNNTSSIQLNSYPLTVTKLNETIQKLDKKIKKEEKNYMEILNFYMRNITEKIHCETAKKIDELIEKDIIQQIIQDAENQINVILDNDEEHAFSFGKKYLLTEKTDYEIKNIRFEEKEKLRAIEYKIEEVKAQLEIAETYETKIEILKRYDILTEDGKINTEIEKINKSKKK